MALKSCFKIAFILGLVLLCTNAEGKVFNVVSYGAKADAVTDNSKTLTFDFINNAVVHNIRSINSKGVHFDVFKCNDVRFSHINITAPGDSPNTDGMRIGFSTNIQVLDSNIGTGDDCIAIIAGSKSINVSGVTCGPGHGISIGSLGNTPNPVVKDIHVKSCTLTATQNGVRIKTRAPSNAGIATMITFEDIIMNNVWNPIFIDQHYCAPDDCSTQTSSVQVKDVTYNNIRGTSSSVAAVTFNCSAKFPCQGIKLHDINLSYNDPGGPAISICANARGTPTGKELPPSCLKPKGDLKASYLDVVHGKSDDNDDITTKKMRPDEK
ncbi:hypothetical protein RND71_019216 [Anisodus tanguticus]|uniref:Uncharacterized protein n=1 Tax=Anisodus tanguticus TaxID=243964 RepID=A0AAE1VG93_9SOLA|nr:hypothetical protein RND71_019216 [Anisodus tanguticus]